MDHTDKKEEIKIKFINVSKDENKEHLALVKHVFTETLTPLYGSQESALSKISEGKDRTCELAILDDTNKSPVGIIVYKHELHNEFETMGKKNVFEIKTLFLLDARNNSGRGLGGQLLKRIEEKAKEKLISCEKIDKINMVVTVSENKQESYTFFTKKGFENFHTQVKYRNVENKEHFLCKEISRENKQK